MNLNQQLFNFIYGFAHRNFFLDDLGVFFAQYLPYLLGLGFLILAFNNKDWRIKFLVFVDGAIAVILSRGIVTELIRYFYHHPRPFDALGFAPMVSESGYSFPSGHAAFFFALAMIVFFYNRRLGAWYFLFAIANGIARIFVGVHWPLDILGGAIVGILCGIISHKLIEPTLKILPARVA